ncbi:hypothetical protein C1752_00596 [Acaryochloris thomasi RCC1774]|uniref:Uncharacterized protein n=1 Tax=Acaryochloris thomasi RCC1774 TaxID=1764569 RepID=A0A2W1JNG5_9CYAN|nr:hypothetical protein C1752_00596 [Acaryochloris thomasi RCC1774]
MFTHQEQQPTQRPALINQADHPYIWAALQFIVESIKKRVSSSLQSWQTQVRSHYYQASRTGLDFYLEECSENSTEFCMTSQRPGVKVNDLIIVSHTYNCINYKILEISYYPNFSDMWVARIVEI